MHVSRGVLDVETAVKKLNSRFRGRPQILRPEWPVISATRPLFYLLRLFGLAPFEISKDHFIATSYDVIYSLFCSLVNTYAMYIVLTNRVPRETVILDFIELSKVVFNYCIAILNILVAVYTRKELIGVLNIIKHFDSRIRDLGYPRKEGTTKIWAWGTCVCIAFFYITINRSAMAAFDVLWIKNMVYLQSYLATSLSTVKFSSIVLLLGQRFRHLNKVAHLSKKLVTTKQNCIPVDLKVIQQLHNSLMTAGESLSSQYAWPLLLWLMNLCIHSVSNIYFLIDWVMIPPEWAKTQWLLINSVTWSLVTYLAQLLLLHIACHYTSSEANSIGSIFINWKCLATNRIYSAETSVHLINRKLNFTAAGCFSVDLPLLSTTAALLTTYLVLLKQFQN